MTRWRKGWSKEPPVHLRPGAASGTVVATVAEVEEEHEVQYMRVVLREDQFDRIREIVREEIRATLDGGSSQKGGGD